jgi:hypothetical protein
MMGSETYRRRIKKGEMIMSTKSQIATLAAVAIVIAVPAFAGQRVKPTLHSAFAGAFASSDNPARQPGSAACEQQPEPRFLTRALPGFWH